MEAATNLDERRRLSVLESYEVLDSEAESAFDRVVRTAARIFRTPMASVSLVDANRQWFKACVGIDATETSREISFCTHALASDDVLVIPDATADPRFSSNPVVTGDPFVRFYAGAPLIAPSGERLGTLCVIDTAPREPLNAEDQHTLVELAALVMDLLETRKAGLQREAALAEADETNRLLVAAVESSIDAIVTKDPTGIVTSWNPAAERLYGYPAAEMIGSSVSRLMPEDLKGEERKILARILRGESIEHYETRRVTKAGDVIDIALSASPVRGSDGTVIGAASIARDIRESKAIQRALEISEQQSRAIIDTAHDAYIAIDEASRITDWNAAAETMFGWSREAILGRSLVETLIPPQHREPHSAGLERYLSTGQGPILRQNVEIEALTRDGRTLPVELTIWPMQGENETSFHAFVRDTSQRAAAEAALREGREMAERANLAKSDFLSRMSHELRTPLNAILGFGQLLELDDLTDDQAQNVAEMIRGGKHLLELINEILDISRIETGRMSLSIEPVPLAHVVEAATSLVCPLAAQRGIDLKIQPIDVALHVRADQQRLKQILLNLLSNAIKYNREGGSVNVSCSQSEDGRVILSVADTGAGIRPDQVEAIFTPFERLDAEAGYVEGTGLGLAISRRLAEAMEGHLGVTSVVGSGSIFSLELSAMSDGGSHDAVTELPVPQLETASTILYVEDNVSNLRLMERIVARTKDVRLISCGLGAEAAPTAARERPDLVLLDLNLPDIPGRDVLQRLQVDPLTADIPVVVLSADATQGQMNRLLQLGARAYMTKPIDVAAFKRVIEEVLAGRTEPQLLVQDPR